MRFQNGSNKMVIDGLTLEGALWVIRARGGKIYVFLHISVLSFIFDKNFYCKQRNPFSVFTSVSESIELGISLLIRVTEMLFCGLSG